MEKSEKQLEYRAISLYQPWASLVGLKQFETRSFPTKWKGKLLICSTKQPTCIAHLKDLGYLWGNWPTEPDDEIITATPEQKAIAEYWIPSGEIIAQVEQQLVKP